MFVKPRKKSQLDLEIETKLDELRAVVRDDEKYEAILSKLERLYKIKEKEPTLKGFVARRTLSGFIGIT